MAPKRLTQDEIQSALADTKDWTMVEGREAIQRTFTFADFKEAWAFMSKSALKAEEMGHHPPDDAGAYLEASGPSLAGAQKGDGQAQATTGLC